LDYLQCATTSLEECLNSFWLDELPGLQESRTSSRLFISCATMEEIAGTAEEGAGIVGLPPSPNWFCSAAVSVQGRLVAYAAATKVVVLDGQRLVRTQLLPKRVMSVCWLQGRSRALAVGLDDGAVGTFDLSGGSTVHSVDPSGGALPHTLVHSDSHARSRT
jgi:hypothetical protein